MPNYPEIPVRLLEIDELIVSEHYHIDLDDDCYFLWERISGASYQGSATNDLISNLQIPVTCSPNRLYWKTGAISFSARALGQLIPDGWKENGTFIPIPPSYVKGDERHDARILRVLKATPGLLDVRELVVQIENTNSKEKNISPEARAANYEVQEALDEPEPEHVIIFDDVVAGASHFKAMKMIVEGRFHGVRITGLFLARSIRPNFDLVVPL